MDPIIQRFRQRLERQRAKRVRRNRRQSVDQAQHHQEHGRATSPINQPTRFKQRVRRAISWGSNTTTISRIRQSSASDTSSESDIDRPPPYELAMEVLPTYYDEYGRPRSPLPIYIDEHGRPRSPVPFWMLLEHPMGLQPGEEFHRGQNPFGHDDVDVSHQRRVNAWTREEEGPQVQEREIILDEDESEWEDYTETVADSSSLQVDNTIAPIVEELEGNPHLDTFGIFGRGTPASRLEYLDEGVTPSPLVEVQPLSPRGSPPLRRGLRYTGRGTNFNDDLSAATRSTLSRDEEEYSNEEALTPISLPV